MIVDPKESPGFHHERFVEEPPEDETRSTIADFNHAATRTQRGSLRLQSVASAVQHGARDVRTATAERKRSRQSSHPSTSGLPAVAANQPADPKLRFD